MAHLNALLERINDDARNRVQLGRQFERIIQRALTEHNTPYSDWFHTVHSWDEFRNLELKAGRDDPGTDTGVDLVGVLKDDKGLCAIQVKCYDKNRVAISEVDKFLSRANTDEFSERMFISTTGVSDKAYNKLDRARARVVGRERINSWLPDWRKVLDGPSEVKLGGVRYQPRPDQHEAIRLVSKGLFAAQPDGGVGTMVMPCGTGKSVTALWIAERNVIRASAHPSAQRNGADLADERLPPDGRVTAGKVLYLVPSLALMSQTMREWAAQRNRDAYEARFVSVCSDRKATRSLYGGDKDFDLPEIPIPPTTDSETLAEQLTEAGDDVLTCVFATYQSLDVVVAAQANAGDAGEFDLVICDEAHRTASVGKTKQTKGEANFLLVHDQERLRARHRLFMTATPRVYTDKAKQSATAQEVDLYSMDDEDIFGPRLYEMSFREAIDAGLLVDYEVILVEANLEGIEHLMATHVTSVNKRATPEAEDDQFEWGIQVEEAAKLLGCWDALADPYTTGLGDHPEPAGLLNPDPRKFPPLQRVIGFTNRVNRSKQAEKDWLTLLDAAREVHSSDYEAAEQRRVDAGVMGATVRVHAEHIDGTMSSWDRDLALERLRNDEAADNDKSWSRVLMNARCLSEGVDVPALDAVLFLDPRQSAIDVVQAVGRVMRRADDRGKEKGYIILPILVEPGETIVSEETLKSDSWKMVARVLSALRAHDDQLSGKLLSDVIAQERLPIRVIRPKPPGPRPTPPDDADADDRSPEYVQEMLMLAEGKLPLRVASRLTKWCGDKKFWPNWGKHVRAIVDRISEIIAEVVTGPGEAADAFANFAQQVHLATFAEPSRGELIEMLAQHEVTAPIFADLLEDGRTFVESNPVGAAMARISVLLRGTGDDETLSDQQREMREQVALLERQTARMRQSISQLDTPEAKLDALKDIYETFFTEAMPRAVGVLGIGYTDAEITDFILRCADTALKKHLGAEHGLGDPSVNVLDPATGTGTFIYRVLTGLNSDGKPFIGDEHLDVKYGIGEAGEPIEHGVKLHANELLLLAYYVALLKIEEGYLQRKEQARQTAPVDTTYKGIALVDTLRSGEVYKAERSGDRATLLPTDESLRENYERLREGRDCIQAIVGNPPWVVGQKSAQQDLEKQTQDYIEQRVLETYSRTQAEMTGRVGGSAMGAMQVRFFRWATDELAAHGAGGVVAFVHMNSVLTGTSLAGMRRKLREEFDYVYVVDVRGNAHKQGEAWAIEGDKIFPQFRVGVQITVCVRLHDEQRAARIEARRRQTLDDHDRPEFGEVRLAQCDERLTRQRKLNWLEQMCDIRSADFELVAPNAREDWEHQSDGTFGDLVPLTQASDRVGIFGASPRGVATSWDDWVYATSRAALRTKVDRALRAFNDALKEAASVAHLATGGLRGREFTAALDGVVAEHTRNRLDDGSTVQEIKWCDHHRKLLTKKLKAHLNDGTALNELKLVYDEQRERLCQYRPFTARWMYWDYDLLSSVPRDLRRMFPPDAGGGIRIFTSTPSQTANFTALATWKAGDLKAAGIDAACRTLCPS